jgi:two-component sensor histidine kinase
MIFRKILLLAIVLIWCDLTYASAAISPASANNYSKETTNRYGSKIFIGKKKTKVKFVYDPIKLSYKDSLLKLIQRRKDTLLKYEATKKIKEAALICSKISFNYQNIEYHDESNKMAERAITLYKIAGGAGIAWPYCLAAYNYYNLGNYQDALNYDLIALKVSQEMSYNSHMTDICGLLVLLYTEMDNFKDAEKYGRIGLETVIQRRYPNYVNDVFIFANGIAFSLNGLRKYNEAISILKKTEKEFPPRNQTDSLYLLTRLADSYIYKAQFDHAKIYIQRMMNMSIKHLPGDVEYNHWFFSLTQYLVQEKDFRGLNVFLKKYKPSIGLAAIDHMTLYRREFQVDSALGNYKAAMMAQIAHKRLSDSIFNENKSQQISKLNIQFETAAKDRELLLQKQRMQLQKAQLERSHAVRNVFYYISGSLLMITLLLISLYRLKNRRNRELDYQRNLISHKNGKLKQLLREKEWLLKEIHHRVKNNLQIVMSLLNSQGAYVKEGAAFDAIQESQARVNSMAMIHQKLYKSSDMSSIDLPDYITDLVNYFRSTYVMRQSVTFQLDLSPLVVDVSVAVPIALILNEAITNSFKYAFSDRKQGLIKVSLSSRHNGDIILIISDNGIGLPPGFDPKKQFSLGMSLIRGLSEDIGGHYSIDGKNGTTISVIITKEALAELLITFDDTDIP